MLRRVLDAEIPGKRRRDWSNVGCLNTVAYPELVSRGVSERRKCTWLVKVGASNGVNPPYLKKIMVGGGFPGSH